jgi:hypothetical protein
MEIKCDNNISAYIQSVTNKEQKRGKGMNE